MAFSLVNKVTNNKTNT